MTRKTSIETYHQIEAEGLLSKLRWKVYKHLWHHGPLTGAQIINHFCSNKSDGEVPNPGAFNTRLSELRDLNVIEELGTAVCPITGRNVLLWDVTDRLPIKKERHLTPRQKLKEKIVRLERKLFDLKKQLKSLDAKDTCSAEVMELSIWRK